MLLATATLGCNEAPKPWSQRVSLIGRFDLRDPNAPRFAWSGSQIRARFSGTWVRIVLSDAAVDPRMHEADWIDVSVDDAPAKTFRLTAGRHVYPVAIGLDDGKHEIRIAKRTEAAVGVITFHGLQVPAGTKITPILRSKRVLEFVGDSITAGYGIEGVGPACSWSAERENNLLTYAAVAARQLKAEYTAVAGSGKGVTRNYDPTDPTTLPEMYPRVIPSDESSPTAATRPLPDAFIVNLGTNDMAHGIADPTLFQTRYLALLKVLRARAPQALIVLALGPMLNDQPPARMERSIMRSWLAAIEAQWRRSSDDRITSIEFWNRRAEGYGCDFHPSIQTHARMGQELSTLLRQHLGW